MIIKQKLEQACDIAQSAGDIALKYFRQNISVENKLSDGNFDPVTQADKEVEAYIREALAQAYPEDAILGEEQGESLGQSAENSEFRWVIDPIDGTRGFMTGLPLWGTLIGLQQRGQPVAGLMYQPFTGELFSGHADVAHLESEYTRQGKQSTRIQTSNRSSLKEANLYTTTPDTYPPHPGSWEKYLELAEQVQLSRFGGDCYTYCLLAMGQVDIVVDGSLQPYDIVPLIPIIEAAGGVVTNWQGESAADGGLVIAAANKELHKQALNILKN